jgi:hypothetical protein
MPDRNAVKQRKAKNSAKLDMLQKAARAGFRAMDRGEFKEFNSTDDLQTYLYDLSEKVILASTARKKPTRPRETAAPRPRRR